MKNREKKAIELIKDNKQESLLVEIPAEKPEQEEQVKKKTIKKGPTYWTCVNGHVFEHKYHVPEDRMDGMKCPVCNGKIKHKVNKSRYIDYLNDAGRGDKLEFRRQKKKKEAKTIELNSEE